MAEQVNEHQENVERFRIEQEQRVELFKAEAEQRVKLSEARVELFKTAATFGFGVIALNWASALILLIFVKDIEESLRRNVACTAAIGGLAIALAHIMHDH